MRVHLDRTVGRGPRNLVKIQILALTACLLCGLAAMRALARSQNESASAEPVYYDTAEGLKRLEESRARHSFVPLSMYFETQKTQTYCGVATSTIVLNALAPKDTRPRTEAWGKYGFYTQDGFFTPEVLKIAKPEEVRHNGMTLDQLGGALKTFPVGVTIAHASDKSEATFRQEATNVLKGSASLLIVNFDRQKVSQEGSGHFSPIAAYDEKTDSFLIFDVARYKYHPAWVKSSDLWKAMLSPDKDAKMATRGYLIVSKL